MSTKVHEYVTQRMIEILSKGTVPWRKPWTGEPIRPTNLSTMKPYNGCNRWLLDPSVNGYTSPYWVTFKQAGTLGGSVKRGEKSSMIVFWKWIEDKKTLKRFPFLRYTNVWNLEQCEGLQAPANVRDVHNHERSTDCESVFANWSNKCLLKEADQGRCFYTPATDTITMQPLERFESRDAYYSTLFHEMIHATGHKSRLDRLDHGKSAYAREELIAEMGAQFLCEHMGINNASLIHNSASYIADWIKHLQNDSNLIVSASSKADKAVNLILNKDTNEPVKDTSDDE